MADMILTSKNLVINGYFRKPKKLRILDSPDLIRSLITIRDTSKEQATKTNIDTLIKMILDLNLEH